MNKLNFKNIFNRNIIKPNINYKIFANKKILVTGSSGSIGTEIIKKLKKYTKYITRADINIDVTKKSNIHKLKKTNFDFAFHLAADKRADFAELNPSKVSILNILSTSNIDPPLFKTLRPPKSLHRLSEGPQRRVASALYFFKLFPHFPVSRGPC